MDEALLLCQDCPVPALCGERGACDRAERASRMAVASTGDELADRRAVMDAARHDQLLDQNLCPNGCGVLIEDEGDKSTRYCPECHFAQHSVVVGANFFGG